MNRFFNATLAFTILAVCLSMPTIAQEKKSDEEKTQNWLGTLDVGGVKLRLQLKLTRNNHGRFSAVMYSLDQGNAEMPIDSVQLKDQQIEFEAAKFRLKYAGKISEDGQTITGTFTQMGRPFALTFAKVEIVVADKHIETWKGILKAGPREFDFQLRIYQIADGKLSGQLDSFSENLFNLPLEYSVDGAEVTFDLAVTRAKYSGKLSKDKDKIRGIWEQNGNRLELNFESVPLEKTRKPSANRPQTPKPPFPYDSRDVSYVNKIDKVELAGTITTPRGPGPFPAVVLISGSGPQDRDSTIAGHKSFWVIADALTRKGIAVLRYDERGIGKSKGSLINATSVDLARDVEAGINFLKSHSKIDKTKIGLIGHSEGGYIAPMIAARNRDVAYIVMLAGPAVPGRQIVINQTRLIMESTGANAEILDLTTSFSKALFEQLEKSAGSENVLDQLQSRFDHFVEGVPDREKLGDLKSQREGLSRMTSPWFRFFANHDPRTDLRKVTCPVLAINGTVDLQVDADLNLPEIEKALKQAGNRDFTLKRLEKLNHLFQKSETGRIDEYAKLTETFNQDALNLVVDWVVEKTK